MKKYLFTSLFFYCSLAFSEGYVCIGDKSTGFRYDKSSKSWITSTFNVSDSKYTLTLSNGQWKWNKLGEKSSLPSDCGKFNEYGYLHCSPLLKKLTFNKKNLRYMLIYDVGYVNGGLFGNEGEDTPNMEIGKCSPL